MTFRTTQRPQRALRRTARRGLTLVEVLVAAVILSIAAVAALELLASGDAASASARRSAVAALEAERALAEAADLVRESRAASARFVFEGDGETEPLRGCTLEVRESRETIRFSDGAANGRRMPVARLVAEIVSPEGDVLASFERLTPVGALEDAP